MSFKRPPDSYETFSEDEEREFAKKDEPLEVSVNRNFGAIIAVKQADNYFSLIFDANRCAIYHGMRMYFFDFWGKAISLFAFVSSSASIASVISVNKTYLTLFTVMTAMFAGLNIIVGLGNKAKEHGLNI